MKLVWDKEIQTEIKKTKPIIGKYIAEKKTKIFIGSKNLFEGKDGSFYQENYQLLKEFRIKIT